MLGLIAKIGRCFFGSTFASLLKHTSRLPELLSNGISDGVLDVLGGVITRGGVGRPPCYRRHIRT